MKNRDSHDCLQDVEMMMHLRECRILSRALKDGNLLVQELAVVVGDDYRMCVAGHGDGFVFQPQVQVVA